MSEKIDKKTCIDTIESAYSELTELSDQSIMDQCLDSKPDAWNEFFRRYARLLYTAIQNTLRLYGNPKMHPWDDEDIIGDIHDELVIKLISNNQLEKCKADYLRPWLGRMAINQTISWFRERGRDKRLPGLSAEHFMTSLDDTVFDDYETTMADMLSSDDDTINMTLLFPEEFDPNERDRSVDTIYRLERFYLDHILSRIDAMKYEGKQNSVRDYWIMRLSIIIQHPLDPEEIEQLQAYSPLVGSDVSKKLRKMMISGDRKASQRDAELGRAIINWHKIRRLEAEFSLLDNTDSAQAHKMLEEIRELNRKHSELMEDGKKIPHPQYIDIAELVGISADQKDYVCTILKRTRKLLKQPVC